MHTLVSSQPIRLIRLYERKRKIYGKNNTVIGKHLQTWTVFFYCLARTWKKKQSIVWYSWLQPLSSLNRAIKRTQSQKKWFSVVFFFLVFLSFVKQIGNSNHNALPLSMQDESFFFWFSNWKTLFDGKFSIIPKTKIQHILSVFYAHHDYTQTISIQHKQIISIINWEKEILKKKKKK